VTSLAFLRLSTHPKVLSRPLTNQEAWDIYQRYRIDAGIDFIQDSPGVAPEFMTMSCVNPFPHHLWTDAYLAALARYRSCRIVSFDTDFNRFSDLSFLHLFH
jgi:hypothetical protein